MLLTEQVRCLHGSTYNLSSSVRDHASQMCFSRIMCKQNSKGPSSQICITGFTMTLLTAEVRNFYGSTYNFVSPLLETMLLQHEVRTECQGAIFSDFTPPVRRADSMQECEHRDRNKERPGGATLSP